MKKISSIITIAGIILLPVLASAAWTNITEAITEWKTLLNSLGGVLITAATVFFFWGVVKFIYQDKKEEGKVNMVWGIVGLFVLFTIWGIIAFMQNSTIKDAGGQVLTPVMRISDQ